MPLTQLVPAKPGESRGKPARHYALLAGVLALAAVLLRIMLTRHLDFCGTPDACFYLGMAQNLGSGHGFSARFLYDYQLAHLSIPNTGIEYWRPGISLILLLSKLTGGVTLHSSIFVTCFVGVLFAAAAWHIAMQTYGDPRLAFASFALCLSMSPVWVGSLTPDSGLYYGAAVAWFLGLFTVRRQGLLQDVLGLGCVSLAYLIRNDAALLLFPLLAVLWHRSRRRSSSDKPRTAGNSPLYIAALLLGFGLALAPMHLMYRAVLGHAFPSGTAQTLYFRSLDDFNRYHDPATLPRLLSLGPKRLLGVRVAALSSILYRFAALMIGYPALIFLPMLLLRRPEEQLQEGPHSAPKRLPEYTGAAAFALVALAAYALVIPAIGAFAALRTAVAFVPLVSVLVVVGIVRGSRSERVATVLVAGVIAANAVSGVMQDLRDIDTSNGRGATDRAEAAELAHLDAQTSSALVLTADPVQFSVTTGYATAPLPSNGLDAIVQAAHDLGATHVILDTGNLPAPAEELERRLQPVRSTVLPESHALILALGPKHGAS